MPHVPFKCYACDFLHYFEFAYGTSVNDINLIDWHCDCGEEIFIWNLPVAVVLLNGNQSSSSRGPAS